MNLITRRGFIARLFAAAAALAIKIPAADERRAPYVQKGDCASYIGPCPGGFIGAQTVVEIGQWDGVGYPVTTLNNAFGTKDRREVYYDFDLCEFNRELPERFWSIPGTQETYPNVHSYVRTKRFGETIHEAIRRMNRASCNPYDWPERAALP